MGTERSIEIMLRDLVREAIGLEGIGILGEDSYTQKIDRVRIGKIESPWTDLRMKAEDDPVATKIEIQDALKNNDGSFDGIGDMIKHPAGEGAPSDRTVRRMAYWLFGGADAALNVAERYKDDDEDGKKERRKARKGGRKAHRGEKSHQRR